MTAQNTTVALAANSWTQLTLSDVTAIRVVNLGSESIWLMGTASAVTPSSTNGAIPLLPGQVLAADLTLAQLFPGVAGVVRVYAYTSPAATASVSHA